MRPAAASMRAMSAWTSSGTSSRLPLEPLAVHADLAQRLLQVVRRDGCELLELGVRAGQCVCALLGELGALGHPRLERLVESGDLRVRGTASSAARTCERRNGIRLAPPTSAGEHDHAPQQPRARTAGARIQRSRGLGDRTSCQPEPPIVAAAT